MPTEDSPTVARIKKNPVHLLLKDLLENYDLRVRPVVNYSNTVNVSVRLTLHLIRELVSNFLISFMIMSNSFFDKIWSDILLSMSL